MSSFHRPAQISSTPAHTLKPGVLASTYSPIAGKAPQKDPWGLLLSQSEGIETPTIPV